MSAKSFGQIRPSHLRFAARIDSNVASKIRNGDKVLNSELRRDLAIYGQTFTVRTKEAE